MTFFLYTMIFIAGAVIGSFVNVLIYRLPVGRNVISGKSMCQTCSAEILKKDLVPILSWLIVRGKCRNCEDKISIQYPIIEFLTGAIFLSVFLIDQNILLPIAMSLFLAMAFIDIHHKLIPDNINISLFVVALLSTALSDSPLELIQAAFIAVGAFEVLRFLSSFVMEREALGEADVLVAGSIGAMVGLYGIIIVVLISQILSIAYVLYSAKAQRSEMNDEYPMIPFLFVGTLVFLLLEDNFKSMVA